MVNKESTTPRPTKPLVTCLLINLVVGNFVLLIAGIGVVYHLLVSIVVAAVYSFVFFAFSQQSASPSKIVTALVAIALTLTGLLMACIFTAISVRFPDDDLLTAAAKGVAPLFFYAIVLASPLWIPLAILNHICLTVATKHNAANVKDS